MSGVASALAVLSRWLVPLLLALIPVYGQLRGVRVYERFVAGAMAGLELSWRILPNMVAIVVALSIFRESGALALLARGLAPLTDRLGFPHAVLPLLLIRPLSGAGALAAATDLLRVHGPDSFVGRLASVLQGSTDTTFYVLTVYFGAVGVRRTRYAAGVGLLADCTGFLAALLTSRWFFR